MTTRDVNGYMVHEPAPGEVFELALFPELGPLVAKFNVENIFNRRGEQVKSVCEACVLHRLPVSSRMACLAVACMKDDRSDKESVIIVRAP